MLLAVDIGNTQTHLGVFAGEELAVSWRLATCSADTGDELLMSLRELLAASPGLECAGFDGAVIASVVPQLSARWQAACQALCQSPALLLDSAVAANCGLKYKYPNPAEIGADRLADALAALHLYGPPVIVVDFGTATNIEVIDASGAFVGGIIAPGLATSANALFAAAARLPRLDLQTPAQVIGTDTKSAVQSGLCYGEIDRVDGLVKRVFAQLGYEAMVVATGGLSARVIELSSTIKAVNDNLTLEGLRLAYERNIALPEVSDGAGT